MTETAFRNARIVLRDDIVHGSLLVRDGRIADVAEGGGHVGEDLDGDALLPGIVELHTDHLEHHFTPRPKTRWDAVPAVLSHDAQLAGAGVTTVFDAVRIGAMTGDGAVVTQAAEELITAIEHAAASGITRAEHYVHLRCEVSAPDCLSAFDEVAEHGIIRLASLMDHTPGQRQYADVEAFRTYMVGKGRVSEGELEGFMAELRRSAEEFSEVHRLAVAERARQRGIVLAAHDDATAEHVAEAQAIGVAISEFPTTAVAARAAREQGQRIVMGAPNIVRGGSQSGNVAATALLAEGLLDILSSDYVPASPLQAIFQLVAAGELSLPEGSRLLSTNPADAVGLRDRGRIEPGLRADLVRVHAHRGALLGGAPVAVPVVRGVWREGRRAA